MALVACMLDSCRRTSPVIVALLFVTLFTSVSCQPPLEVDGDVSVIRRATSTDPKTIDPHEAGDVLSSTMCGLAYDQLLEYVYFSQDAELKPCLAAKMPEVSPDALDYIFTIRDDIYFQDDECFPGGKGRKLVVQDIEYSFKRFATLVDSPGYWVLQGKIKDLDGWRSRVLALSSESDNSPETEKRRNEVFEQKVSGISILDDHRIRFTLTEPYPQFLYAITLSYGAIVPREAAQYYGDKFSENPVGTGPYKLREWRHDKHLIWDKNPTYREEYYPIVPEKLHLPAGMPTRESFLPYQGKRLPLSDRVVVQVLKEAQVSWFQFQSGHIDTSLLDKDTFTTAVQNQTKLTSGMAGKGIRLTYYPSPTISYLSFNMDDPVVGTPAGVKGAAIRKALSLSFDQADYIKRYLQGQGEPATMLIPPGVFGYNDSYQYRWARYAPEEGIRLLKDAGFIVEQKGGTVVTKDPKTGEQLQLLVVQAGQSTASADYARYLNFSGARIGIRVDSEQVTYSEYLKRQQNGIGQAYDSGWIMDYPDPQNMMQLLYGPNAKTINSSSYNSSRYNQLYEAMSSIDHTSPATSAADIQRKKDLVVEMHRVLDDDCPWLIQYFDKTYVLTHAWQNTTLPNHFAYNIYKYRYSDPRLRIDLAGDWNKADALPGILFACLVVTVIVMFVARIVRQE